MDKAPFAVTRISVILRIDGVEQKFGMAWDDEAEVTDEAIEEMLQRIRFTVKYERDKQIG